MQEVYTPGGTSCRRLLLENPDNIVLLCSAIAKVKIKQQLFLK